MTQRSTSSSDEISTADLLPVLASNEGFQHEGPHELECLIQRRLQSQPGLRFSRLTVHQCPQGIYLDGMLEANEDGVDLCELVNEIAGIQAINRVVMRSVLPK